MNECRSSSMRLRFPFHPSAFIVHPFFCCRRAFFIGLLSHFKKLQAHAFRPFEKTDLATIG